MSSPVTTSPMMTERVPLITSAVDIIIRKTYSAPI